MKTIKLLLIEDDRNLGYILKSNMEDMIGDYEVELAYNGKEGLAHFKSFVPDVIVSDIEMPEMNGLEMVKKIREADLDVPVIFATAKVTSKDVIVGYKAGVDNYIKKPFTPEELDAHIKTLLNIKNNCRLRLKNAIHTIGKYTFDPKNLSIRYGEDSKEKRLTLRESQILELLLKNKGEIVKRETFLEAFWEDSVPTYAFKSLDVFLTKLRRYLSKDNSISIKNVKSIGYILEFD